MLKPLLSLLPAPVRHLVSSTRRRLMDVYAVKSYSQEGEDMILSRVFGDKKSGFYVDVGAHHPRRFSNTYIFYQRGWRGINIEPNPDMFKVFESERGRDKNLQMGVSEVEGVLTYHLFDEPALNSFDSQIVKERLSTTSYKVVGTKEVKVDRLENILREHVPGGQVIDFLTIDVEGLDFSVLKSNDWNCYRPKLVLVEALSQILEDTLDSEIYHFMRQHRYKLFAKTFNTLFFCEETYFG